MDPIDFSSPATVHSILSSLLVLTDQLLAKELLFVDNNHMRKYHN